MELSSKLCETSPAALCWCPQHKGDMELLKEVQRRATENDQWLENLSYGGQAEGVGAGEETALLEQPSST